MSLCIIRFFFKAGFFLYPNKFVAQETFASLREKFIAHKAAKFTKQQRFGNWFNFSLYNIHSESHHKSATHPAPQTKAN